MEAKVGDKIRIVKSMLAPDGEDYFGKEGYVTRKEESKDGAWLFGTWGFLPIKADEYIIL